MGTRPTCGHPNKRVNNHICLSLNNIFQGSVLGISLTLDKDIPETEP